MDFPHFFVATIVVSISLAPASRAQVNPMGFEKRVESKVASSPTEGKKVSASSFAPEAAPSRAGFKSIAPSVRFHKKPFFVLSAAVYAASVADMHQTMHFRNYSWWYEKDPLARPIVKLPAPAYYATGLALATGINWISWKMGHSKTWRKLSPLPQLLAIAGNTYGFKSNCCSNY